MIVGMTVVRINAITVPADSGDIYWQGKRVPIRNPHDATALGIATVYQDLSLCDNLDVAGNLLLGQERRPLLFSPSRFHAAAASLLARLNELGRANGIGRLDMVENRFVGMKSRGVYETPGGTILLAAHRGIESITLDREAAHLKDQLMPRYAELIYNGFWFSPERRMLQALIDESQRSVTGEVRLKLYKGNATVVGRESPNSLYSMRHVTFEEDQGAYDQFDAQGFIKLSALRLRLGAMAGRRGGTL